MTNLIVKNKNKVYFTVQSDEYHRHRELANYLSFKGPEANN